jgi:hypothetical protein
MELIFFLSVRPPIFSQAFKKLIAISAFWTLFAKKLGQFFMILLR